MTTVVPATAQNSRALDQYRGFALLLVLISHGFYLTNAVNGVGRVGVNLFFFISGILVFRSLGSVTRTRSNLERARSFWKRRFIRLFPAMTAYLLAMIPIVYLFQNRPDVPPHSSLAYYVRSLPFALLYVVDYFHAAPASMGHLWSVSVEMQFYALAPLVFIFGGRGVRRRTIVWSALLAALMALGVLELARGYQEKYQFQATVWPMMLGFLMEYKKGWLDRVPRQWLGRGIRIGWIVIAAIELLTLVSQSKALVIAAGAVIIVPCFLSYVSGEAISGWLGAALTWLGERTYSIYLWQQPLTLCGFLPAQLDPLGALVSVGVGALSYRYFERPFLSSKRR